MQHAKDSNKNSEQVSNAGYDHTIALIIKSEFLGFSIVQNCSDSV